MKTTQAYFDATARGITPQSRAWLEELEDRFGEDRVVGAIEAEAAVGKFDKLLGRVRDRLAKEDAQARVYRPAEAGREQLLAIVRGELKPSEPFIFDTRDLSRDEYDEVMAWSLRRVAS